MSTKAKYQNSVLKFYDPALNHETIDAKTPVAFYDDFIGADIVIPATAESGCRWTKKIVAAAGSPTVAGVANETNGVIACTLDATSEAQTAILYTGDQLTFDPGQGLIFETRVKLSVLPTLVTEAVIGIAAAYGVPDNIATSAWFTADGSGELICEADNGSTDTTATSGVTVTNSDWKILRIDCIDEDDVKFYINGVGVATGSTFKTAAKCQPFLGLYKASGAGLGTLQVDYVKIWQKRA